MPSNRNKLRIDRQSFQRVLCAAFTIQEHNARNLTRTSLAHSAECAEPFNCLQGSPDLNLNRVGIGADEGVDAEVMLQRLLEQFDPPAIDESHKGGSEVALIDNKAPDALQEHIAAIAAGQFEQTENCLIAPRAATIEGTDLQGATSGSFPQATDVDAVSGHLLPDIVQQALHATHATSAAIALRRQGKLVCHASTGESASEIGSLINTGSPFMAACASSGTLQSCSNTGVDARLDADAYRNIGVRAITIAPLLRQDQLLGVIAVFSRFPYAFGIRDLQALQDLAEKFTPKLRVSSESMNSANIRIASRQEIQIVLHRGV